jgi:glycosyltransferase involved in cell wall biosynthesis
MVTSNKKTAVITRTKNRPLLLPRAAESVLGQKNNNLVWVVVNNHGARGYVEQCVQDFRSRSDNEAIVTHTDSSVNMEEAINIGIAACDSDYIIIHDDDDSWEPGFLSSCLQFLQRKNSYKGVITLTMAVEEKIEEETVTKLDTRPFNSHLKSVDFAHIAIRNQFPPISFLFSRTIYDELGGFLEDLPLLADWDFILRFLMKADIGLVPKYLANYHLRVADTNSEDEYGNTVVAGLSKHIALESQYRHARYREDIARKEIGLGHLLMSGKQFQLIDEELKRLSIAGHGWRIIQKAARKIGLFR